MQDRRFETDLKPTGPSLTPLADAAAEHVRSGHIVVVERLTGRATSGDRVVVVVELGDPLPGPPDTLQELNLIFHI